jgi:hypothetical protein
MTAMMDVATQYVFSLGLGVDAPSTARSMEVVRTAMCPKDDYFKSMGLTGQYDPTVIPEMLFLDNQADNHGRDQDAMMRDLDIENGYAGSLEWRVHGEQPGRSARSLAPRHAGRRRGPRRSDPARLRRSGLGHRCASRSRASCLSRLSKNSLSSRTCGRQFSLIPCAEPMAEPSTQFDQQTA